MKIFELYEDFDFDLGGGWITPDGEIHNSGNNNHEPYAEKHFGHEGVLDSYKNGFVRFSFSVPLSSGIKSFGVEGRESAIIKSRTIWGPTSLQFETVYISFYTNVNNYKHFKIDISNKREFNDLKRYINTGNAAILRKYSN